MKTINEFVTMVETLLSESMEKVLIPWLVNNTLHELKTKTVGRKRGRDSIANQNTPSKKENK
jgi:hypothetical protein